MDRHQNVSPWSLDHALPEISSKSVHNFFSYPTADRQTDRSENITSFGGGNNSDTCGFGVPLSSRLATALITTVSSCFCSISARHIICVRSVFRFKLYCAWKSRRVRPVSQQMYKNFLLHFTHLPRSLHGPNYAKFGTGIRLADVINCNNLLAIASGVSLWVSNWASLHWLTLSPLIQCRCATVRLWSYVLKR